jgi:hypothetical protein
MQQLFHDIGKWSDTTFGDERLNSTIHHLELEVGELKVDPFEIEEYADCLLLLFDAARKAGFEFSDLLLAAQMKLEKNKARKWGRDLGEGAIGHLPEAET